MKKLCLIVAFLIALASSTVLAGCGGDGKGKKTELVFLGWTNSTESKAYKAVIKIFEQRHNVKVTYNTAAVGEYRTKLNTVLGGDALTGKCTADVFYVPYGMLWNNVISGHIENLQPYIDADDGLNVEDFWDKPGFYQYKLNGDEVGKGDIYAFPKDVGPMAMIYNKNLFAQYGVTAPALDNPWNWDDLLAPVIYLSTPDKFTVPVLLAGMSTRYRIPPWHITMAAATVTVLPCILLFISCQRYFVEGIVTTGIKG